MECAWISAAGLVCTAIAEAPDRNSTVCQFPSDGPQLFAPGTRDVFPAAPMDQNRHGVRTRPLRQEQIDRL
jgi:hypothetical protein